MGDIDSIKKEKYLMSWGYKHSTAIDKKTKINLIPDISSNITLTAQKNYFRQILPLLILIVVIKLIIERQMFTFII